MPKSSDKKPIEKKRVSRKSKAKPKSKRRSRATRNSNATANGNTSRIQITLGGEYKGRGGGGLQGGSTVMVSQPAPVYQTPMGLSYRDHPSFLDPEVTRRLDALGAEVSRLGAIRAQPGAPGRNGIDGAPGRDGIDGLPGRDGVDGLPGRDGADGATGERGLPGRDGDLFFGGTDFVDDDRWETVSAPPSVRDEESFYSASSVRSDTTYDDMPELEAVRPMPTISETMPVLPTPPPIVSETVDESEPVIAEEDIRPSDIREEETPELPGDELPKPESKSKRGRKPKPLSHYQTKLSTAVANQSKGLTDLENGKITLSAYQKLQDTTRKARHEVNKRTPPETDTPIKEEEVTEIPATMPTPRRERLKRQSSDSTTSSTFLTPSRGGGSGGFDANGRLFIRLPNTLPKANSYRDVVETFLHPNVTVRPRIGSATTLGFGDDDDDEF